MLHTCFVHHFAEMGLPRSSWRLRKLSPWLLTVRCASGLVPQHLAPHGSRGRPPTGPQQPTLNPDVIQLLFVQDVKIDSGRWIPPAVLRYDVTRVQGVIDFLNASGINAQKLLKRHPRVLQSKVEMMAANLTFLSTLPIDVPKALEACPWLLYLPIGTIRSKIDHLAGLGLHPMAMIKRNSSVLNCSKRALADGFAFLKESGLDAKRIAIVSPTVLGLPQARIRAHILLLEESGLDSKRIINSQPTLLSRKVHHCLQPSIKYITEDMGRSVEEINRDQDLD